MRPLNGERVGKQSYIQQITIHIRHLLGYTGDITTRGSILSTNQVRSTFSRRNDTNDLPVEVIQRCSFDSNEVSVGNRKSQQFLDVDCGKSDSVVLGDSAMGVDGGLHNGHVSFDTR